MNYTKTDGDWEDEFDSLFFSDLYIGHVKTHGNDNNFEIEKDIKSFIRTEIQKAREEGYKDGLQTNKEK